MDFRLATVVADLCAVAATIAGILPLDFALTTLKIGIFRLVLDLLGLGDVAKSRGLQTRQHLRIEIHNARRQYEHALHRLLAGVGTAEKPAYERNVAKIRDAPTGLFLNVAKISGKHDGFVLEDRRLGKQCGRPCHRHRVDGYRLESTIVKLKRKPDLIRDVRGRRRDDPRLDLKLGAGTHLLQRCDLSSDNLCMVALGVGHLCSEIVHRYERSAGDRPRLALGLERGERGRNRGVVAEIRKSSGKALATKIGRLDEICSILPRCTGHLLFRAFQLQRQLPIHRIVLGQLDNRDINLHQFLRDVKLAD